MEEYIPGHTYTKKISHEDAYKFAKLFGEGSESLTELIRFCILNDIITHASCKGHPEDMNPLDRLVETGYLTLKFPDSRELAYFIASLALEMPGIVSAVENNIHVNNTITLYVPARKKNMSEKYFAYILSRLKYYYKMKQANEPYEPNSEIKKIVDYIFNFPSDESFEINHRGYKKTERKNYYLKTIGRCPHKKNNYIHKKLAEMQEERFIKFLNKTTKSK